MDNPIFWSRFVLTALATWRITHLFALEDGPADLAAKLRDAVAGSFAASALNCFACLSLWVALPLAFAVPGRGMEVALIWVALSGSAFALQRLIPEPLIIEKFSEANGEENDLLRPQTDGAEPAITENDARTV